MPQTYIHIQTHTHESWKKAIESVTDVKMKIYNHSSPHG